MYDIIGWIMVFISIIASILSSKYQNRYSMILYIITAMWWSYYNILVIQEYHQGCLRLFYFGMGIIGWFSWSEKDKIRRAKDEEITELKLKLKEYENENNNLRKKC